MSYYRKARLQMDAQALDQADSLLALAIASANRSPKPDASVLTRVHSSRSTLASWRSRHDTALEEGRSALAYAIEANEPLQEPGLQSMIASDFLHLGRLDSALAHARIGVDMARRLWAPDHRSVAIALGRLADVQVARGRYPEAIAAEEEAVRILRARGRETTRSRSSWRHSAASTGRQGNSTKESA